MKVHTPKGFGKNYFTLAAIQAYISLQKIVARSSSVCTLDGKPLTITINSPSSFLNILTQYNTNKNI